METSDQINRTGTRRVAARLAAMRKLGDLSPTGPTEPGPDADGIRRLAAEAGGCLGAIADGPDPEAPPELLDSLGGRLAFERAGVRLYEAVLRKAAFLGASADCIRDLGRIRDDEAEHMGMLSEMIADLGGDPTMETPCADREGVMSSGLGAVVNDPRSSLADCLHAALVAELADVDAWNLLIASADPALDAGRLKAMREAQEDEDEHLELIRTWHAHERGIPGIEPADAG